jgi:hypothetical protein
VSNDLSELGEKDGLGIAADGGAADEDEGGVEGNGSMISRNTTRISTPWRAPTMA